MKLLIRTLLVLVFLLACTHGIFVVRYVASQSFAEEQIDVEETKKEVKSTMLFGWLPARSPASSILTKLGLAPLGPATKNTAAVVIENHEVARLHHKGLEEALMIQEWMVEGLISRFIVIIDTDNPPESIGPIRSLRPYFVDGVRPLSLVFIHAGGSPEALEKFNGTGSITTINGITGSYYNLFDRDNEVAAPHNFFLSKESLGIILKSLQPKAVKWPPYKIGRADPAAPKVHDIDINYYSPVHNVHFTYLPDEQAYIRSNGSVLNHATVENVLITEIPIVSIGELGRLDIPAKGNGDAILFRSGKMYEGMWYKDSIHEPFRFTGSGSKPLLFGQGQTWMTVVPSLERVSWKKVQDSE